LIRQYDIISRGGLRDLSIILLVRSAIEDKNKTRYIFKHKGSQNLYNVHPKDGRDVPQ
jgi:hypothetical protein